MVRPRIVFLNNQAFGQIFRELAVDLTDRIGPGVFYVGSEKSRRIGNLYIRKAPRYRSESTLLRLWTWSLYLLWVTCACVVTPGSPLVFAVSNPPFTPLAAWLLKHLRGWRYVCLMWDIYPEALVRLGFLSERSWIVRLWRVVNRITLGGADAVITIGPHMAQTLNRDLPNTAVDVLVIPNWANTQVISPRPKLDNPFAVKHGQVDKFTVLYSGNMGLAHDLDTLLGVARRWRDRSDVGFLLIGQGEKYQVLERAIIDGKLSNVTILPLQPEAVLPYSLSAGDVAVVSLDRGAEGVAMPSRTYFMMAAGCAIVGVSSGENDLRDTLEIHGCGLSVEPGDVDGLETALQRFYDSPAFLAECRRNARAAAVREYSHQQSVERYLDLLEPLLPGAQVTDEE